MEDDKIVAHIFSTTDYDKFRLIDDNRELRSIGKILRSIQAVGQVMSPILVNEKMEVIDGQHRLAAFKKLGCPVYYMVQEGIGIEECRNLNTGQTNWTTNDYVHSYATEGVPDYVRLTSLLDEFGGVYKLEGILAFIVNRRILGGGMHVVVKEKKLRLSEKKFQLIRTRLQSAIDLGFCDLQRSNKLAARSWYQAVSYAYRHQDVSVRELAEKLKKAPLELVSYSKPEDQLALFDKIYNKGKRNKVFMSADYQKGRFLNDDDE